MPIVIIRDDDTCACTPVACLERLYRPLLDLGLAVNLSVIPEARTNILSADGRQEGFLTAGSVSDQPLMPMTDNPELVSYLKAERGYRIVQHGCHHDLFEFDSFDRLDIARRLERGAQCLEDAGLGRPSTFVAPYDRMSREAYCEVAARFKVISTGWFEAGRVPLPWWPAYAMKKARKRAHWHAGGVTMLSHPGCLLSYHRPYGEMLNTVRHSIESQPLTVLVTHWWEYFRNGEPDEPFIAVLHELAHWLASRPDILVASFQDIVTGKVSVDS